MVLLGEGEVESDLLPLPQADGGEALRLPNRIQDVAELTPKLRARIVDLYASLGNLERVSERTLVKRDLCVRVLEEAGVRRRRKQTELDRAKLVADFHRGCSVTRLAELHHTTDERVKAELRASGLEPPRPHGNKAWKNFVF